MADLNPISIYGGSDYVTNILPQGLEGSEAANASPPPLSTSQSWWDSLKNDTLSGVGWVEDKVTGAVVSIYDTGKTVVGTVVSDVTAPIANAAKETYGYILLGIVVVGAVIYFAGKSGALKVRV